jgi:hypothetical protein
VVRCSDALEPVGSRRTSQPWRWSVNTGVEPAPALHVDGRWRSAPTSCPRWTW